RADRSGCIERECSLKTERRIKRRFGQKSGHLAVRWNAGRSSAGIHAVAIGKIKGECYVLRIGIGQRDAHARRTTALDINSSCLDRSFGGDRDFTPRVATVRRRIKELGIAARSWVRHD